MKLKRNLENFYFEVAGGTVVHTVNLPAGLKVRPIKGRAGEYWIDEFPPKIFPKGSMILHDATHYGIVVKEEDVEDDVKEITLTIKIPARFKYLAIQPYGEISLFTERPEIVEETEGDAKVRYWGQQNDEKSLIYSGLIHLQDVTDWEHSVRRI